MKVQKRRVFQGDGKVASVEEARRQRIERARGALRQRGKVGSVGGRGRVWKS